MSEAEQSILEKIHSETALMHWKDLQRFFAQGNVLCVQAPLNLVKTAVSFAENETATLAPHIESETIAQPTNEQARAWYDADAELWAVVVAPYVLVQQQD